MFILNQYPLVSKWRCSYLSVNTSHETRISLMYTQGLTLDIEATCNQSLSNQESVYPRPIQVVKVEDMLSRIRITPMKHVFLLCKLKACSSKQRVMKASAVQGVYTLNQYPWSGSGHGFFPIRYQIPAAIQNIRHLISINPLQSYWCTMPL